jgi:DNA polymerase I
MSALPVYIHPLETVPITYTCDQLEAGQLIDSLNVSDAIGLDIETYSIPHGTGFCPFRAAVRLVQIYDRSKCIVIDIAHTGMFKKLRDILENPGLVKVAHNAKFEWKQIFRQYGIMIKNVYCTMVGDQVLKAGQENTFNLEDMSYRRLGISLNKVWQKSDWGGQLVWDQIVYAAMDSITCLEIYFQQVQEALQRNLIHILKLEMRVLKAISKMELTGLPYSLEGLKKLGESLKSEYETQLAKAQSMLPRVPLPSGMIGKTGVNKAAREKGWHDGYRSPETRDDFIKAFKSIGVEIPQARKKNTSGVWEVKESLSKETYGKIKHPAGKILQRWNSTKHIYNTYVKGAIPTQTDSGWFNPITGRVHPSINQCGTVTGRFSMSEPNFQNIPRKETRFRPLLYALPGYSILKADYSQIEMKVMAQVSKDANLIQAYIEGKDVHAMTAAKIFKRTPEDYIGYDSNKVLKEERQLGKNVNFGSLYGQGAIGLQQYIYKETEIEYTLEQCEQFLKAFFDVFPGIKRYHRAMQEHVVNSVLSNPNTYDINTGSVTVETLLQRARVWKDVTITPRRNNRTGEIWYSARINEELNLPIQGTVGDIMKVVMARLDEEDLDDENKLMILQVHDELVFMVKDEYVESFGQKVEQVMVEEMSKVINVVPIKVDVTVGINWAGERKAA